MLGFPVMARPSKPKKTPRRKAAPEPAEAAAGKPVSAREFSAGGVVFRPVGKMGWEIAVIEPRREGARGKPVLALPKGWVDAGEKPEQTAIREVKEETGLEAEIVGKLGDIKYVYVRKWSDGARVFKV